jgi:thiamine biosynthesis protein ThiS
METVFLRDTVFFMNLTINGQLHETLSAATVMELLEELSILPGRVAVEVNMNIISKTDYAKFRLHDGDAVEIINFVGGG